MGNVKADLASFTDRGMMPVVYEADVTQAPYNADSAGIEDATQAIQNAVNDVAASGGGAVLVPPGEYRITGEIAVKPQVCLVGQYKRSVLKVDNETEGDENSSALITLKGGNAGIRGLTFWYPRQNLAKPLKYQYAIGINGSFNSVFDCFFINAYNAVLCHGPLGIGTFSGLSGTVLNTGIYTDDESDITTYTGIDFSPSFWARADKNYAPPKESEIREFMSSVQSRGFAAGSLERVEMSNISLDGFDIGFHNFNWPRVWFSASINELEIQNSRVGMLFEKTDNRYGVNLFRCRVEGSEASVINNTDGWLKFADSRLKGDVISPDNVFFSTRTDVAPVKFPSLDPEPPKSVLYNVTEDFNADNTGENDMSSIIQEVLDRAGRSGGGIVYLSGGVYLIGKPLSIPANTQLRGCAYMPATTASDSLCGTSLLITCGKDEPDGAPAITLAGKNAGLCGLRIYYPDNGATTDPAFKLHEYPFTVKGEAKGVYVKYVTMVAAWRAIWMDKADSFIVDRLLGTIYSCAVRATDCKDGCVNGIQTNGHYETSAASLSMNGTALWEKKDVYRVIDNYLIPNLSMIEAVNCKKLVVFNSFFYGGHRFITLENSDAVTVNTESARCLGADNIHAVFAGRAEAVLINTIRPRTDWIQDNAAESVQLTMINRCAAFQLTDDYTVTKKRNEEKKFLGIF